MRALSASTSVFDPYRAGIALGEALAPLRPEVVLLFSSTHYSTPELLEGMHDALDDDGVIVVGNSGNGVLTPGGPCDHGATALALNSDGKVCWQLEHLAGLDDGLEDKFVQLMSRLDAHGRTPGFGILISDFRVDAGRIESLLARHTRFPVVGGLATDGRQRSACYLYVGRAVVSDALFVLAAYGEMRFSIALASSRQTVGRAGVVDATQGTELLRIDGVKATEFIEHETGKPILHTDRGVLSLLVSSPLVEDEMRLRTLVYDVPKQPGALALFGAIAAGNRVQLCRNQPDDLIDEVRAIAAAEAGRAGAQAVAAAVLISCSGRKFLLGQRIAEEVGALTDAFSRELPLAGFLSAGEVAPRRRSESPDTYTRNLFHNMSCVLLLIGA